MDLYEVLRVDSSASSQEIKKAYHKLALRYHPDKATDEDREFHEHKFKEISHAYEILSDEHARRHYDAFGSSDPSGFDPSSFSGNPFDNYFGGAPDDDYDASDFTNFFHNMNGNAHFNATHDRSQLKRTDDATLSVSVSLEDLYLGKTIRITSTRNIICSLCLGTGAKKKAVPRPCHACNGLGLVQKINRIAPGFVTQSYIACPTCEGTGKKFRPRDNCRRCNGQRVTEDTKILEFEISRGSSNTGLVVLQGELDQYPGKVTGDVILQYTTKPHATFTRIGNDLYAKHKIPLLLALCGFSRTLVKLLDGRGLLISTPAGKVVRPGDYIRVVGEGMPRLKKQGLAGWFAGSDSQCGDLYVEMDIEFPQDQWYLERNDLVKLGNVLPHQLHKADATAESACPDASIEVVADFSIVEKLALPTYRESLLPPKPEPLQNGAPHTECAQQ